MMEHVAIARAFHAWRLSRIRRGLALAAVVVALGISMPAAGDRDAQTQPSHPSIRIAQADLPGDDDLDFDDDLFAEDLGSEDDLELDVDPDGESDVELADDVDNQSDVESAEDLDAEREELDPRVSSETPSEDVEEILITGAAASAAQVDAPTSVTSFDAAELDAMGVADVGDLAIATPNLEIRRASATTASFFIRGVGLADFGVNATSAVAVSQDGVGVSTAPLQLAQIFDASVDILRGPRGSGAFRNGSAGAIVITSQPPSFEYGGSLRSSLGTWAPTVRGAHHGLIQDYEGFLNIPIVDDILATRLSFRVRQAEPYRVNGCGSATPFSERVPRMGLNTDPGPASQCGEKNVVTFPSLNPITGVPDGISPIPEGLSDLFGEEDNWAARGQLLFHPSDTAHEIQVILRGSRLDQQPVVGQAFGTGFFPNATPPAFLGGIVNGAGSFATAYTEPDQRRQFLSLCNLQQPQNTCANPLAGAKLARDLARNLDKRPYRGDYNREGATRLEIFGVNLRGNFVILEEGFSTLEISSRTGFDRYERFRNRDQDNTPETIFEAKDDDRTEQIWQELALSGSLSSEFIDWELGTFYFWEEIDANLFLVLPVSPLSPFDEDFFGVRRLFVQETRSVATWANASWEFRENLTLDAGVRFNWEDKSFDFERRQASISQFLQQEETWGEWTGSLSLEYAATEEVSFALSYTRGFKPGTFNAGVNAQQQTDPVDPEFLDSFEGIVNASFFADRVALRAEIFYYLYENYQLFLFSDQPTGPPVLEVQNADSVENYGADIDLTFLPLEGFVDARYEGLSVNFRIGWLESQFIDFTNQRLFRNPAGITIPVTVDFTGNRLPNSPQFSVNGIIEWPFDLGRFGLLTPRYHFSYTADTFFDAEEGRGNVRPNGQNVLPEFTTGQPAFILHNLRLTWRAPNEALEVAAWVRNVRDVRYKLFAFDASQFSNLVIANVGQPRTFGLDLKFTF